MGAIKNVRRKDNFRGVLKKNDWKRKKKCF